MKTFQIIAIWDDEAEVWSVDDSDIPGLVAWGATRKELIEKLEILVPEMLELNGPLIDDNISKRVPIELIANSSKRFEVARRA